MKQLNCWVPEEFAAEVERAASEDDRSVSAWIKIAIREALKAKQEKEPV